MVCPQCGREYPSGVTKCEDCGVALVEPAPARDTSEWADLVTVFVTGDEAQLVIARSLLEAEGIPVVLEGQGVEELVGLGRTGTGASIAGSVRLRVRVEDEEAARGLLAGSSEIQLEPDSEPPAGDPS